MNILIRREKEFSYWSTRIKVQIDSFYAGELSNGEEKLFPASDGPHYVSLLVGKKVHVTVPVMQQPDMPDPFISCRFNMKGDIEITGSTSGLPPQVNQQKKRHGCLGSFLAVFGVFLFLIGIFSANSGGTKSSTVKKSNSNSNSNKSDTITEPAEDEPEIIAISAEELWTAYDENKVKADSLYKDKILDVTGVISDITQDVITKNPCVTLESGHTYGFYPILCFFDGSEETANIIAELSDGQKITVRGECDGTPAVQIQMSKCAILE